MTSTPPAKQPASLFGRWTGDVISGRWTPSSKGEASGSARGKGGNAAERQFGVDITSPTINRTAATSAAEHGNSAKGLTPAFISIHAVSLFEEKMSKLWHILSMLSEKRLRPD